MTPNDWLTEVREDLLEVVEDDSVVTKGMIEQFEDMEVSVTIMEQSDCFEAYVVVEPEGDINQGIETVKHIRSVIGQDDQLDRAVGTDRNNNWAESNFKADVEKLRRL